jgi:hypothetical protein
MLSADGRCRDLGDDVDCIVRNFSAVFASRLQRCRGGVGIFGKARSSPRIVNPQLPSWRRYWPFRRRPPSRGRYPARRWGRPVRRWIEPVSHPHLATRRCGLRQPPVSDTKTTALGDYAPMRRSTAGQSGSTRAPEHARHTCARPATWTISRASVRLRLHELPVPDSATSLRLTHESDDIADTRKS